MKRVILTLNALNHTIIKLLAASTNRCADLENRKSFTSVTGVSVPSDLCSVALWLCHSYSKIDSLGLLIHFFDIIMQVFVGLFHNAVKGKDKTIHSLMMG